MGLFRVEICTCGGQTWAGGGGGGRPRARLIWAPECMLCTPTRAPGVTVRCRLAVP